MEIILFLLIIFFPAFMNNEAWIIPRFLISIYLFVQIIKINSFKINKTLLFLFFFLFYFILRAFFSENIFNSIYSINWYLILIFSLFIFINKKKIVSLKKIYFLSLFISVLAILDFINLFSYIQSILESGLIIGISNVVSDASLWFINGNYAGSFILMSSIPGLIFCIKKKKIYLYNIIIALGIYCTGNTTALWIFLICNLISLSFFKRYRIFLFLGLIIIGISFTTYLIFIDNISSSTLMHRSIFFKNALVNIKENFLFGKGPGMFRYYFYKNFKSLRLNRTVDYLPPSHYVHNDYIQLIFEIGLPALLFIIFLFIYILKNSQRNVFIIFLPLMLSMFIQHTLYFEKSMFVFMYILAQFLKKDSFKVISEKFIVFKSIKVLLFMIIIVNLLYFQGSLSFEYSNNSRVLEKSSLFRPGYSFLLTKTGISYMEKNNFKKAESFFRKSQFYDKYWGDMYYRLTFVNRFNKDYDSMFSNFKKAIEFNNSKKSFEYTSEALFFAWQQNRKKDIEFFKKKLILYANTTQEKKLKNEILKKIEKL